MEIDFYHFLQHKNYRPSNDPKEVVLSQRLFIKRWRYKEFGIEQVLRKDLYCGLSSR